MLLASVIDPLCGTFFCYRAIALLPNIADRGGIWGGGPLPSLLGIVPEQNDTGCYVRNMSSVNQTKLDELERKSAERAEVVNRAARSGRRVLGGAARVILRGGLRTAGAAAAAASAAVTAAAGGDGGGGGGGMLLSESVGWPNNSSHSGGGGRGRGVLPHGRALGSDLWNESSPYVDPVAHLFEAGAAESGRQEFVCQRSWESEIDWGGLTAAGTWLGAAVAVKTLLLLWYIGVFRAHDHPPHPAQAAVSVRGAAALLVAP